MRTVQRDVVKYWHLVELFSPQKVSPPDPRNRRAPVVMWREGRPLPWDAMPPPTSRGKGRLVWRHTVFLGVYDVENIYAHLHAVFPRDQDAYEPRPHGLSACAAFMVDHDGRYVSASAVLSSALWGIGRTISPGVREAGWFEGFATADERLRDSFSEYLAEAHLGDHGAEPTLRPHDILKFLALGANAAGIHGIEGLHTKRVHIASVAIREDRAPDLPGTDFLNSFHLNDLRDVANASWGRALDTYLTTDTAVQTENRVDVRKSPHVVIAGTGPDQMPIGRWLSDPTQPLSSSQQFAVNQALSMGNGPMSLVGVNGPPGTGKTTMLRDVLAGIVTSRASALAALGQPDDAFSGGIHKWKTAGYSRQVKELRAEITGHEMVVASANNAAVANVSDELPLRENIHSTWHTVDYFADIATEIGRRTRDDDDGPDPRPRWGVVAARLGNSANRNNFESAFWFGRPPEHAGLGDSGAQPSVPGLLERLKGWEADPSTRPSWSDARAAFLEAHATVQSILADRRAAADRLLRAAELPGECERWSGEVHRAEKFIETAQTELAASRVELANLAQHAAAARDRHRRQLPLRPGWWEAVISRGRATRDWRQVLRALTEAVNEAEAQVLGENSRAELLRSELGQRRSSLDTVTARLKELRSEQTLLGALLDDDRDRYGRTYPGPGWSDDERERELSGAWLDPEVNRARSDLFCAALDLHLAFLAGLTGARQCLQGSLDVMSGRAPGDIPPAARLAAWQFLFLAVPLVSTTFASVPSMLKGLEPEALGWLLIDEAGQASPQEAVGAIWRAKRVLVVGDPMQLAPVVTVPPKAQHDLAKQFNLSETWIPSYSSVQHLADRVGPFGTTLSIGERRLWVSSPLRLHRRCDSPMFDISNQIAYEGLMINGVSRDREVRPELPSSQWFDVPATQIGTHLQVEQIAFLREQLAQLVAAGVRPKDMIVIAPFRPIALELERLRDDFQGITAGTIHTAQGREADVVFLVLGSDPQKPGARRWASETPSLLNVAVSRARHRLYVIGDHSAWAPFPYFDTAATFLDSVQH